MDKNRYAIFLSSINTEEIDYPYKFVQCKVRRTHCLTTEYDIVEGVVVFNMNAEESLHIAFNNGCSSFIFIDEWRCNQIFSNGVTTSLNAVANRFVADLVVYTSEWFDWKGSTSVTQSMTAVTYYKPLIALNGIIIPIMECYKIIDKENNQQQDLKMYSDFFIDYMKNNYYHRFPSAIEYHAILLSDYIIDNSHIAIASGIYEGLLKWLKAFVAYIDIIKIQYKDKEFTCIIQGDNDYIKRIQNRIELYFNLIDMDVEIAVEHSLECRSGLTDINKLIVYIK